MNDLSNVYAFQETIDAVLEGGPLDFPADTRRCRAARDERTVKVLHRGGYEHFERAAERSPQDGGAPAVYQWTSRTRIAE